MTADELDIPTLDLAWCCDAAELPSHWHGWGEHTRHNRADGRGVHFYKHDYQWRSIYNDPGRLVRFGCPVVVEANYSTHPGMPRALVLADIYRKRRLSSLWGAAGIRILVDLNLNPAFYDLALLGVPYGWTSYATRKHHDMSWDFTVHEYQMARERACGDLLFVVFGGGVPAKEACAERGWPWVPGCRKVRALRSARDGLA
jgi:hypothetical protein